MSQEQTKLMGQEKDTREKYVEMKEYYGKVCEENQQEKKLSIFSV